MANVRLGLDAGLYRNSANYASPTWVEINNVRDVTVTLEKDESDVTTRGTGGWRARVATLKDLNVEFEMVAFAADTDLAAVRDAFINGTTLDIAVMDTEINTVGAEGPRAEMEVFSFSRNEPLTEGLTYSVSLRPTLGANAPTWMTVSS